MLFTLPPHERGTLMPASYAEPWPGKKTKMKNKEEKLIAYCGLYCDECFAHRGIIADLARDLRKELRRTRFDIMAGALSEVPFLIQYP